MFHWNKDKTFKFITLYREQECLWNPKSQYYKNSYSRTAAYQRLIDQMDNDALSVKSVKAKIKNLRSTYHQELNKVNHSKRSGAAEIYRPRLSWFNTMHGFLADHVDSATTILEEEISQTSSDTSTLNGNRNPTPYLIQPDPDFGIKEENREVRTIEENPEVKTIDNLLHNIPQSDESSESFEQPTSSWYAPSVDPRRDLQDDSGPDNTILQSTSVTNTLDENIIAYTLQETELQVKEEVADSQEIPVIPEQTPFSHYEPEVEPHPQAAEVPTSSWQAKFVPTKKALKRMRSARVGAATVNPPHQEDEFHYFGLSISAQLRKLPLQNAMMMMAQFQTCSLKRGCGLLNSSKPAMQERLRLQRNYDVLMTKEEFQENLKSI